jgi:cytochrome c oxidase cbb3-type subunit I/II
MPQYPWLLEDQLDANSTIAKIKAMQRLGVPYPEGYDKIAIKTWKSKQKKLQLI